MIVGCSDADTNFFHRDERIFGALIAQLKHKVSSAVVFVKVRGMRRASPADVKGLRVLTKSFLEEGLRCIGKSKFLSLHYLVLGVASKHWNTSMKLVQRFSFISYCYINYFYYMFF